MATVTAGDLINSTLRLNGMLAEGEVPSAATSQDMLTALNLMVESWSIERLSVFCTKDQVFTWPSNEDTRTLGPTGNFVGTRPVKLDVSTYYKDSNDISYTPQFVNEDQYNGITVKNITSNYPQVIFVDQTYPDTTMKIYPIPSQALEWHFISVSVLDNPATLATVLLFPPGYLRAFKYALACEGAAEFGVEPSKTVQRLAMISKRNLKRINNPEVLMSMPFSLINNTQRYNIYTDSQG